MLVSRRARFLLLIVLTALLGISVVLGIALGATNIPLSSIFSSLRDMFAGVESGVEQQVITGIRLPRVLLGLATGAGLAICGLITQSLLRNPLGDPYILGISSGASTGAALVIVLGSSHAILASLGITVGAFLGALLAMICVGFLASAGGRITPARIIFAGMAVNYFFSALTSLITVMAKNAAGAKSVVFWMLGSLTSASWNDVRIATTCTALAFALFFLMGRRVDVLNLGDDCARSLGTNPRTYRALLISIVAFTVAVLVSLTGAIGFIGLVIPHLAKLLVGSTTRNTLPVALLAGGILVVVADLCARLIIRPAELPIGILTALVGTPMLMALIKKHAK
ncbi:FecCD family ABC transporter permease [Actinotignum schaalii]|uniref:FecCD family ABC transporter permease n=1 Tax=Actinotignum schaalii TaxID=59505 RepID=UPI00047B16D1|nr:iron ABC transporter permease [Actinotignum schaalii]AIE82271.1 ABC transporter permease [Actinotignum schaalii]